MTWWYVIYLWLTFSNPQSAYFAPPPAPVVQQYVAPTRPPVYWTSAAPATTFNPADWPPGYIPNPDQLGLR